MKKIRIIASKSGNHVVFISTAFGKNGFAEGRPMIGALEFDPAKYANVAEAVETAKKLKWDLVPQEGTDFCDVIAL